MWHSLIWQHVESSVLPTDLQAKPRSRSKKLSTGFFQSVMPLSFSLSVTLPLSLTLSPSLPLAICQKVMIFESSCDVMPTHKKYMVDRKVSKLTICSRNIVQVA